MVLVAQERAEPKARIGMDSLVPGPVEKQFAGDGWRSRLFEAVPAGAVELARSPVVAGLPFLARAEPVDVARSRGGPGARPLVEAVDRAAGAEAGYLAEAGASGRVHNLRRTRRGPG